MYNLEKRLIGEAFWALPHAMFINDWKQTAHGLKLQERLLTINKRNIIRWNIYRDKNFHSRIQVFKCLKKSWVFKLKAYVYGCVFFWENPKADFWSQIIWILHYQKNIKSKKDHLPWQRHVLVLLVGKKQHADPRGEDKKKNKSNISYAWIYKKYIFRCETQTFLE